MQQPPQIGFNPNLSIHRLPRSRFTKFQCTNRGVVRGQECKIDGTPTPKTESNRKTGTKRHLWRLQTRFLGSWCVQNAFAVAAPPGTPLGEHTALPRSPSWWGRALPFPEASPQEHLPALSLRSRISLALRVSTVPPPRKIPGYVYVYRDV